MTVYNFSVDAELLRELGERLVGQPHIALAELIKNSYDADATKVAIHFEDDTITVIDNGHGMSEEAFVERWMRVGTTQKRLERFSPLLERPLTGSKGVGRLAAQVLAQDIRIASVAIVPPENPGGELSPAIEAHIDWRDAVRADKLTDVRVPVERLRKSIDFPEDSKHGTRIVLTELAETWDPKRFQALAEEVWALQPPFADPEGRDFEIEVTSPYPDVIAAFDGRMRAIFDIWTAKISGRLLPEDVDMASIAVLSLPGNLPFRDEDESSDEIEEESDQDEAVDQAVVEDRISAARRLLPTRYLEVSVELKDGPTRNVVWQVENCDVDQLTFDFRVFRLESRQLFGIRVGEAREYLRRFGGIAIYDNGFRLPYYGAEQDWLAIERDHSARLTASKLLPAGLSVTRGLLDLPTNRRLFGSAAISTNHEARVRTSLGIDDVSGLSVQVTRDRLVDNHAYQRLRVMVRAAVDLYAMEYARWRVTPLIPLEEASVLDPRPKASEQFAEVRETLESARASMPAPVYERIAAAVTTAVDTATREETTSRAYSAILGALATSGMTSLAYEHEMGKQIETINALAARLESVSDDVPGEAGDVIRASISEMRSWATRARRIRQVFRPLIDKEVRETEKRFLARKTIESIVDQVESLRGGIPVDVRGVPKDLHLPRAAYPAWSSLFQNLFANAFNALLTVKDAQVEVVGGGSDRAGWIEVRDNGAGVDLATANTLWKPFERRLALPKEREEAGLGGMGLGLTIIRMIADEIDVVVRFVAPPDGFATAARIEWRGHRS